MVGVGTVEPDIALVRAVGKLVAGTQAKDGGGSGSNTAKVHRRNRGIAGVIVGGARVRQGKRLRAAFEIEGGAGERQNGQVVDLVGIVGGIVQLQRATAVGHDGGVVGRIQHEVGASAQPTARLQDGVSGARGVGADHVQEHFGPGAHGGRSGRGEITRRGAI
jgi:hypothetical protein